jgi:hypothetical protein
MLYKKIYIILNIIQQWFVVLVKHHYFKFPGKIFFISLTILLFGIICNKKFKRKRITIRSWLK